MELTLAIEGVDTIAKAEFLTIEDYGDELQGFLFSRPVVAKQARDMQKFLHLDRTFNADVVSLPNFAKLQRGK